MPGFFVHYAFLTRGLLGFWYFSACLIPFLSLANDLYRDTIIRRITTENGTAARMAVFCSAARPPEYNNTAATADWMMPQMIFTRFDGSNEP